MRIGLDAMGGDSAPANVVAGAIQACAHLEAEDRIVLVGDQQAIEACLDGNVPEQLEIHHAPEIIAMDEPPVEAIRTKTQSSLVQMAVMHKAGQLDACVSAGNTGACVAAAQMHLRRLKGVHRPGICILVPTLSGPVSLCDVGANVNCRPAHIHQYGLMASLYLSTMRGMDSPRVGILSIGAEESKGNDLVKQASGLMKNDPNINFIGNVEGRDLFTGVCDVMVCEGFVGNVILKLVEAMSDQLTRTIINRLMETMPDQTETIVQVAQKLKKGFDYNEYGGAPLLGIAGIWFICHGASDDRGIMNAALRAKEYAAGEVNERITELLRDP